MIADPCRDISKNAVLTREEELALVRLAVSDQADEATRTRAIHELIERNLPLVNWLLKPYVRHPDYDDMVMDGRVGLIRAAQRACPSRLGPDGSRFATYAVFLIRQEVYRGMGRRARRLARMPRYVKAAADSASAAGREAPRPLVWISLDDPDSDAAGWIDPQAPNPADTAAYRELAVLVARAMDDLGLGPQEQALLLHERGDTHDDGRRISTTLAQTRNVGESRVRMLKKELLWRVRKRIQELVGRQEYRALGGPTLSRHWRGASTHA